MEVVVRNYKQMCSLASIVAECIVPGDVFLLEGDLGAGKTTLVSSVVGAMGSEDMVSSPSFTIMNCYKAEMPIYHFDLYRINDENELFNLDMHGYLDKKDAVFFIEWSEKLSAFCPDHFFRFKILYPANINKEDIFSEEGCKRIIKIDYQGSKYKKIEQKIMMNVPVNNI
ncbi:MAG: tRNA (adenosine(37)-N6)-threonylcarbamoyltransferase complex ATPase subunit type 1 TsaE [bacterium]|nr:tRNA (adenosine(37)-N6)-threonylcarbamoyltransferase complex ATPase subunit type 1 TsaE [bacterium]